jgi:hypothetical protein
VELRHCFVGQFDPPHSSNGESIMLRKAIASVSLCILVSTGLQADNVEFLSDYSKLTEGGDSGFTKVYIAPGSPDAVGRLSSVMVDQPEFFLDPKSTYKGIKPSDAVLVGEELRGAMISGIGQSIEVVNEPGENTGLISWAVTNIRLDKKKRGALGYTPVGAVAYGVKKSMSDVVEKSRAFDVTFEVEATDVASGEVLFSMIFDMTDAGVEAEWADALMLAEGLGKRIGCRMKNTSLAASDRVDCLAIPISQ